MKIVIKESQMSKVYDKFIERLVNKTIIFEPEVLGDDSKYRYKVMVQFPFHNKPQEQHFNNYDDYSLSLPFITHFIDELKWLGNDLSFRDPRSRQLYDIFIDKFSDKFVNFIEEYESQDDNIG